MSEGTFDLLVRAVACSNCGAPLKVGVEGGTVVCEFCDTTNLVQTRPQEAEHQKPSAADEVARLARLAQQREAKVDNPFDMSTPPKGLSEDADDATLRAELGRILAKPDDETLAADEQRICWIAVTLADRAKDAGDPLRARAQLEGALDHLPDAGYRHLLRARLAVLAARSGEPAAAAAWLAGCDPAPEVLALDTVYRLARAELDLHAGRDDAARERLGTDGIPYDSAYSNERTMLEAVLTKRAGDNVKAYESLELRTSLDPAFLERLRASGLSPELIEDYETTQATVAERMRWAVPVSWVFVLVTVGLAAFFAQLQQQGTLSPVQAGLGYGAALLPLTLGSSLAVGMRSRDGGLYWLGLVGTCITYIPVAGPLIILIISPFSGGSKDSAGPTCPRPSVSSWAAWPCS